MRAEKLGYLEKFEVNCVTFSEVIICFSRFVAGVLTFSLNYSRIPCKQTSSESEKAVSNWKGYRMVFASNFEHAAYSF